MGWHLLNSSHFTHRVASKTPNPWGFFDMHGNVNEWCADYFGEYPDNAVVDPTGPSTGIERVVRGGSFFSMRPGCRSGARRGLRPDFHDASVGFRVVLEFDGGIGIAPAVEIPSNGVHHPLVTTATAQPHVEPAPPASTGEESLSANDAEPVVPQMELPEIPEFDDRPAEAADDANVVDAAMEMPASAQELDAMDDAEPAEANVESDPAAASESPLPAPALPPSTPAAEPARYVELVTPEGPIGQDVEAAKSKPEPAGKNERAAAAEITLPLLEQEARELFGPQSKAQANRASIVEAYATFIGNIEQILETVERVRTSQLMKSVRYCKPKFETALFVSVLPWRTADVPKSLAAVQTNKTKKGYAELLTTVLKQRASSRRTLWAHLVICVPDARFHLAAGYYSPEPPGWKAEIYPTALLEKKGWKLWPAGKQ
jgi:hypothetical protein